MKRIVFSIIILILSSTVFLGMNSAEKIHSEFLALVNSYRAKYGKNQLSLKYHEISQSYTNYQADIDKYIGHRGFDYRGDKVEEKLASDGILDYSKPGSFHVAENVGYCDYSSDAAKRLFDRFVASSSHRKNLLGNFKYTSLGVSISKTGKVILCQLFF